MRLEVIENLMSRDGSSNKDARLTNTLVEIDGQVKYAGIRPALNTIVSGSGAGKGMTCFNSTLISALGTTLYRGETPTSIDSVSGTFFDFVQMP